MIDPRLPDEIRLLLVVDGECHRWTGQHHHANGGDYAYFLGKLLHRVVYELLVGPIPEGHSIDHVWANGCQFTDCCRIEHLEAVTPRENTLRSNAAGAVNARKTECIHGHSLSGENLYVTPDYRRQCRTCIRARSEKYRLKVAA